MSRLMLLAVASWLGLASPGPVRADDAEDRAVKFVEKLRGNINPDEAGPNKRGVAVTLSASLITDAGLKDLAPFRNLTQLNLGQTKITDAGLKEVASFK